MACSNSKLSGNYVEICYEEKFGDVCDNKGGGCVMVYTWYNNDIVNDIYLNPRDVTDSIIAKDSLDGIKLIQRLNRHIK
jgi:hypothetical protein